MQAQSPGVSAPVKTHAFTPALTWQQVEEHESRTVLTSASIAASCSLR